MASECAEDDGGVARGVRGEICAEEKVGSRSPVELEGVVVAAGRGVVSVRWGDGGGWSGVGLEIDAEQVGIVAGDGRASDQRDDALIAGGVLHGKLHPAGIGKALGAGSRRERNSRRPDGQFGW